MSCSQAVFTFEHSAVSILSGLFCCLLGTSACSGSVNRLHGGCNEAIFDF